MLAKHSSVYICYHPTDERLAQTISDALANQGYLVGKYKRSTTQCKGEDQLRLYAHFLIIVTPALLHSLFMGEDGLLQEIDCAFRIRRNVGLMIYRDISPKDLKAILPQTISQQLLQCTGVRVPEGRFHEALIQVQNRLLDVSVDVEVSVHPGWKAETIATTNSTEAPNKLGFNLGEEASGKDYANAVLQWFPMLEEMKSLYEAREYQKAFAISNEIIQIGPAVDAFYVRAMIYLLWGEHELAVKDFDSAIQLMPGFPGSYSYRGSCYIILERYEEACTDLEYAIRLDPTFLFNYFSLGVAHYELGNLDEAMKYLDQYLEDMPADTHAFMIRGKVHLNKENYIAAVQDFTIVINLEPNNAAAHEYRAWAYKKLTSI